MSHDEGMRIRREVLGDEHVDAAVEGMTEDTKDFQDLITRYAWGEIWARPGLDRRTRSAITLMALVALNREHELAMHIRAARRNGLTREEIEAGRERPGIAPRRDFPFLVGQPEEVRRAYAEAMGFGD